MNPVSSHGWLEPIAMDTARARLFEALRRLDRHQRLRLYHPVTAGGEAIYVHAKLMVVDDEVLHVGSSNMNNRSMRLDTECDVTIDAGLEGNEQATAGIARIRSSLLAEHLGVAPERIADVFSKTGSLIETVESLRSPGRSLHSLSGAGLARRREVAGRQRSAGSRWTCRNVREPDAGQAVAWPAPKPCRPPTPPRLPNLTRGWTEAH